MAATRRKHVAEEARILGIAGCAVVVVAIVFVVVFVVVAVAVAVGVVLIFVCFAVFRVSVIDQY